MKRAMARQAEAEREKRAKIIAAEGESLHDGGFPRPPHEHDPGDGGLPVAGDGRCRQTAADFSERAGKGRRCTARPSRRLRAFSNVIMFCIIVATAATLASGGHHMVIASAAQAASALRPFAGQFASTIFALGFIGAGLLAVPVLAGAGSAGLAGLLQKSTGFSARADGGRSTPGRPVPLRGGGCRRPPGCPPSW